MNWRRIVWLLALVTLPTLAEETPLQLALRGAQHDQLYQLSSSGVTKASTLPDSLTTPLGSLWKPDRLQKRLFIRNFFTLQDRLDLTHEYLHLAFDGYPTGLDENYIETLTRQLLMD